MSFKSNAIAPICAQNRTLADDLRAKYQLISNTGTRLYTLGSFATGSPNEHPPQTYENLLEMIHEEAAIISDYTDQLGVLLEEAAIVEHQTHQCLDNIKPGK